MKNMIAGVIAGSAALGSTSAFAAIAPSYSPQLQVRANLAANPGGSFNVPHGSTFGSTTVALNNLGEVASKLSTVGTTSNYGIFYGPGNGTGSVVAQVDSNAAFWSDVSLGDSGRIAVPQSQASVNGIFIRERNAPAGVSLYQLADSLGGLRVLPDGSIGGRKSTGGVQQFFGTNPAGTSTTTFAQATSTPYSFLYTPSFIQGNRIVGKVTDSTQPTTSNDQVRLFNADGSSSLLLSKGQTIGALGTVTAIDNSLAANASGTIAVIATVGGQRTVLRVTSAGAVTVIARNTVGGVTAVDSFAPSINALGDVAFRGNDASGNDAIFASDGTTLLRVIGETDVVPTDLGAAQIGQETTASESFSGGLAINDLGQIAFTTGVYPQGNNQIEYGTAIYLLNPVPEPASLAWLGLSVSLLARRRARTA